MRYSVLIICLFLLASAGCSARKSEPIRGPLTIDTAGVEKGQQVFMKHCNQCHPQGEGGVGPSLNDKKIAPRWLIKLQVRQGVGVMPAFSKDHIGDEELDALVDYIKKLQQH